MKAYYSPLIHRAFIIEKNMPNKSWENIDNVKSELIFQLYPVKKYIDVREFAAT